MDSKIIIQVLNKLIGNTKAVGDAYRDEIYLDNLKNLIDIIDWCLNQMSECAEDRHSFEASVRDIGETAYSALLEYKDWISQVEEELA